MVGREDEAHLMLPAGWWSTVGLVVSLIGVLLLFRYGMPYRVRSAGESYELREGIDEEALKQDRIYNRLGWFGLVLVVLGTIEVDPGFGTG
jgi:hypothetical protein